MSTTNQRPLFCGDHPCSSCPYRVDAKRQLWAVEEFERLLEKDRDLLGAIYRCHKNDGSICRGWLINQRERNFPSVALQINLGTKDISDDYIDGLYSPAPLFETIEAMIQANYPEFSIPVRPLTRMDVIEALVEEKHVKAQILMPPMPAHPDELEIGILGPADSGLRGKVRRISPDVVIHNYGFILSAKFEETTSE